MAARTAPLIVVVSLIAALGFFAGSMFSTNPAHAQQDPGHASLAGTGPGVLQTAVGQEVRVYVRRSDDFAIPEDEKRVVGLKMNVSYLSGTLAAVDAHAIALRRDDAGDAPVLWIPRSSVGYIVNNAGIKSFATVSGESREAINKAFAPKPTTAPKP